MPASSAIAKEDRLSVRIPHSIKEDLIRAANISGVTLGDFVVANAMTAARDIIHSHQLLELSVRDYDTLMKALDTPPKPNSALLKAAMDYNNAITGGDLLIED
jgi:uncharacterized protein (DUF1778 family)